MRNKRIMYIANGRSFFSNNPGRKIYSLVKCFENIGHNIYFICGGDIISANVKGHPKNSKIGTVPQKAIIKQWLPECLRHSISEYRDIKHDKKLYRYLESKVIAQKTDIVWERSSRLHIAGLRLAQKYRIPYVMEWKDNVANYSCSLFKKKALAKEHLKITKATWIVVESGEIAKQLVKKEKIRREKIIVALNAVDPEEFYKPECRNKVRSSFSIKLDTFVIGYVGSFAWYHNTELLCDVAVRLKKKNANQKVLFLMVGDGAGRSAFEKKAAKLGVVDWFLFTGRVPKEKVPEYLAAFDAGVLPGCTDIICPIKVQEYMAASLPVLVPNYSPNREVILHEHDGVLFMPNDAADLTKKVNKIVGSKDFQIELGTNARNKALNELTWERTWGKALEKILSKKSG